MTIAVTRPLLLWSSYKIGMSVTFSEHSWTKPFNCSRQFGHLARRREETRTPHCDGSRKWLLPCEVPNWNMFHLQLMLHEMIHVRIYHHEMLNIKWQWIKGKPAVDSVNISKLNPAVCHSWDLHLHALWGHIIFL